MFFYVLQVALAWLYSHLLEYLLHRYILHKPQRKKWFKTHFAEHHRSARRYLMLDTKYFGLPPISGDPEIKGLIFLGFLHLPIVFFWPLAYCVLILSSVSYYFQHRWQHQSMEYARNNTPWHYDHHMGPDQDANWCVTQPFFDRLMGTRQPFVGTEEEAAQLNRKRKKKIRPLTPEPLYAKG